MGAGVLVRHGQKWVRRHEQRGRPTVVQSLASREEHRGCSRRIQEGISNRRSSSSSSGGGGGSSSSSVIRGWEGQQGGWRRGRVSEKKGEGWRASEQQQQQAGRPAAIWLVWQACLEKACVLESSHIRGRAGGGRSRTRPGAVALRAASTPRGPLWVRLLSVVAAVAFAVMAVAAAAAVKGDVEAAEAITAASGRRHSWEGRRLHGAWA